MPSFQEEALVLAEQILSGTSQVLRMERLRTAFGAAFLHYSRTTPDHWRHPRKHWTGHPDIPSVGACVCLAILASGQDPQEWVIRYFEFLGAMASRLTPEETAFALLPLPACAAKYSSDPRFAAMEQAFREKENPPDTALYRRAKQIAGQLV